MFNKGRKDSNTTLKATTLNTHIREITAGRGKLTKDKLILVEVRYTVIGSLHCECLAKITISKIVPRKILVKAENNYHIEKNICLLL